MVPAPWLPGRAPRRDGTLVYEDEDAFEVQTKRTKQWARPSDKEA